MTPEEEKRMQFLLNMADGRVNAHFRRLEEEQERREEELSARYLRAFITPRRPIPRLPNEVLEWEED